MSVEYLHSNYYGAFVRNLISRKSDFRVAKTTYTQSVTVGRTEVVFDLKGNVLFDYFKSGRTTAMFNSDGGGDYEVLELINLVRKDAKAYLFNTSHKERERIKSKEYIYFSELINKPKSNEIISKIDLRSAYWKMASHRGIISPFTDQRFKQIFEEKSLREPEANITKQMKDARLKALGAMATRKTTTYYKAGVRVGESFYIEETKDLYLDVCRSVDQLMRSCIDENEQAVFYYWDCIFIPSGYEMGVIYYFKELGYDVSVETTTLEMHTIGRSKWLVSKSDDKCYMVKEESRGLIEENYVA